MKQKSFIDVEQVISLAVRTKPTERECPRCTAVLTLNDNEQCYECLNCGYIDCGEDQ